MGDAPADPSPTAAREARLAFLRAQTSPEVVTRAALEACAAGAFVAPAALVFYFLDGLLAAKYPRVPRGFPAPPPPQSFPGVFAAAARHAGACSARSFAWLVLAHAGAAGGREAARLGPRFAPPPGAAGAPPPPPPASAHDWRVAGVSFAAGSVAAVALTADWARAMGRGRRGVYVALAGVAGVALPFAMARVGPSVKRALARLSPAPQ